MESRKRPPNSENKIKTREEIMAELKENALYTVKEASELLNVSIKSVRRAIDAGKIKTVRLGRFLRIPAAEILKLAKGEVALLSVQEASELLSVSKHMVRSFIKSGKLEAFRLAKTGPYKIPKSEIDRINREGIVK